MRQFLLVSTATLFAGCGMQDKNARPVGATGSTGAGSARFEMTMPFGPVGLNDVKVVGAIDYDRERAVELGSSELDFVGWQSEQRFIGRTAYTGWAPIGGDCWRWLEMKNYEPSNPVELLLSLHGSAQPDRLAKLLYTSSRNVENLGADNVRGASTKHQRFHVGKEGANDWSDYRVVDAWIDDAALVRRLRFAHGPDDPGPIFIEFFDFGAKTRIEVPPAEDQISGDELDAWMDPQAADDGVSVVCSRVRGGVSVGGT